MRHHLIWFLAILFLLLLQISVFTPLRLSLLNLLLVLIVVSLIFASFDFGLAISLLCGILLDFLSGSADGVISFTLVSVFLLMYFVINFIVAREPSLIILFSSVIGATIGYYLVFVAFNQLFGLFGLSDSINYTNLFRDQLSISLILNLAFTYPILRFYLFIEKLSRTGERNEKQPI